MKKKIETGADVRELRNELGLKQYEFAKLMGYKSNWGWISNIENGMEPTPKFLLACNLLADHTAKQRQAVKDAKDNLKKQIESFNRSLQS